MQNVLYFDVLGLLRAFWAGSPDPYRSLQLHFADLLVDQASKLAVPHILEALEVFFFRGSISCSFYSGC